MEKILTKLPELHRNMVQKTLDIINSDVSDDVKSLFVSRLKGQADMLLAEKLISVDDYLFMVRG